jgi:hypothetical protein
MQELCEREYLDLVNFVLFYLDNKHPVQFREHLKKKKKKKKKRRRRRRRWWWWRKRILIEQGNYRKINHTNL